jgi:hypothetical protein
MKKICSVVFLPPAFAGFLLLHVQSASSRLPRWILAFAWARQRPLSICREVSTASRKAGGLY